MRFFKQLNALYVDIVVHLFTTINLLLTSTTAFFAYIQTIIALFIALVTISTTITNL